MNHLDHYLDEQLSRGRSYFAKEEAVMALGCTPEAFFHQVDQEAKARESLVMVDST